MEQAKGNQARRLARLQAQQPPQRRLPQAGGLAAATPTRSRPVPEVFQPSPIRSTAFKGVVGDDKGKTFNELVGGHLASRDLARFSSVNRTVRRQVAPMLNEQKRNAMAARIQHAYRGYASLPMMYYNGVGDLSNAETLPEVARNLAHQRRTADPADYRDAFQYTKMMIDRDPAYNPEEHLLATRRGTPLFTTDAERGR